MPRLPAAAVPLAAVLAACSPTHNWRDVRVPPDLQALLPCKPEQGARRVPMAGREVELSVTGCDAGGATYAVLTADIGDPARAGEVLTQWNAATLANMQGQPTASQAFVPPGASALPGSVRVQAAGRRRDGSAVRGDAAYFARGTRVYQAVVYADQPRAEAVQPFFDGLKLR